MQTEIVNLLDVMKANRRVEASLNRRFERDSDLYINKQDVEAIKEWLQVGNFALVFSKYQAGSIHADVYFNTILKYGWLIHEITPKQFREYIKPIIDNVRTKYAKYYLQQVADRKLDLPDTLQYELLKYYAQTLTFDEVSQILKGGQKIGVIRQRMLVARLLSQSVGTVQFRDVFKQMEQEYPTIKGDIQFFSYIFVPEHLQEVHMGEMVKWLNDLAGTSNVTQYYINGLYFNYELLYKIAKQEGLVNGQHREKRKLWYKQIAVAAQKIIRPKTNDIRRQQVTKEVIELYETIKRQDFDASNFYIRYSLKRISHKYFREQLNHYFTLQRQQAVQQEFKQDLQDALTGENSGEFRSMQQLLRAYSGQSQDGRYVSYLAIQFIKLRPKKEDWLLLFNEFDYQSRKMGHFVSMVLKIAKANDKVWQSYFDAIQSKQLQESYAMEVILLDAPSNNVAKAYIETNDYQKYSEIYRV